jgi:hypothetical protein
MAATVNSDTVNTDTVNTDPQRFGDLMAWEVSRLAREQGKGLVITTDPVTNLPIYRLTTPGDQS